MQRRRALFLCTGNSARSQMAEGFVTAMLDDRWVAFSAGTHPAGYVHPLAVQAMAEVGIDISGQRSKSVAEFQGMEMDLVVTVCDQAAKSCPTWLGSGRVAHVGFPDPAAETGALAERLEAFRRVRDAIQHDLVDHLDEYAEPTCSMLRISPRL